MKEVGSEAMQLTSAAMVAASGTLPNRGGLYDQPNVLVEAMAVVGGVAREAREWEGRKAHG